MTDPVSGRFPLITDERLQSPLSRFFSIVGRDALYQNILLTMCDAAYRNFSASGVTLN